MQLCFATNNKNKLKEIRLLLGDAITVLSLQDIDCHEELPETQTTIEGNSAQKANYVFNKYKVPCFADDTGLEIDALNGEPGVYSARYAGPDCKAEDNMALVLEKLKGNANRKAKFKTVITLVGLSEKELQLEGIVEGNIREELSGSEGFGYDPIFEPEGYDITFSEMSMEDKNAISHRGKAVRKLVDYLRGQ